MFVTNHVLSGVIVGRALERRPAAAFLAGVASHLLLDMVPHWGCGSSAPFEEGLFLRYARRDGVLGLAAAAGATLAVHPRARTATLAAIAGATLLDADKPMQYFFGHDPFPRLISQIHKRVQNESSGGLPRELAFGVLCALVDACIAARGRRRLTLTGPGRTATTRRVSE